MARKAREWVQPLDRAPEALYGLNEEGEDGFFPVGAHAFWHGGVHFVPEEADELRAMADGELIAARLPPDPDPLPARTLLWQQVSRGFVLIRHTLPLPEGDATVWSLTLHLEPFDYDADDERAPAPLRDALRRYRSFKGEHGARLGGRPWSARYYEVALAEDPRDPLASSGDAWGLRLREESADRDVLAVLPPGTLCKVLRAPQRGWARVEVEPDPAVSVPPGTAFTHPLRGLIYTRRQGNQERVRGIDPRPHLPIAELRAGKIALLSEAVRAGAVLGRAGPFAGGRRVHLEVFSADPVHAKVDELNGLDVYDDDRDDDHLVDVEALTDRIELLEPWVGATNAAKLAASQGRTAAARFHTEWRVADWGFLQNLPLTDALRRRARGLIERMLWWDRVRALCDAAGRQADLPSDPRTWHYHPVTFVARLQAAFGAGGSLHSEPAAPAQPAPAGAVNSADPAPFRRLSNGYHRYDAPDDTDDPRHVIFQSLAETEGKYDTVNMWDSAIVSLGIGQWTLIHGKLQKLLDVLRRSRPDDYQRLVVEGLQLDLPAQRRRHDDLRMIHDGETLTRGQATVDQSALVQRIRARIAALPQSEVTRRQRQWPGMLAHDFEWTEFETTFRDVDEEFERRLREVTATADFDWPRFVAVFEDTNRHYRDRDNTDRAGTRAWIDRFEACGRDPVMRQVQYELKNFDLFAFFRKTIRIRQGWRRHNNKVGADYRAPLGTEFGPVWQLVDGDLWLQTLTYNLYVNAPAIAFAVIGGAIHTLAERRGWEDDFTSWDAERDDWRDEFVQLLTEVNATCTHRQETRNGQLWRPWRDSRHRKAERAYQTLAGDETEARNDPDFGGIAFDDQGRPSGPANAIAGLRLALQATDTVTYLRGDIPISPNA